jgi:ribonuclease III
MTTAHLPPRPELAALEAQLDYRFKRRDVLECALTHRSFAYEQPSGTCEHNESLEFLGDAVLGLIVSQMLITAFPNCSEGVLAKFKAHLVGSHHLADCAKTLRIGDFLRINRGEEKTGGRTKRALLENAFEAVLAAIYLDGGLDEATRLVHRLFAPSLAKLDPSDVTLSDAKTALQDWLRAHKMPLPEYRTAGAEGPPHAPVFSVHLSVNQRLLAAGQGTSLKSAQQSAAAVALATLRSQGVAPLID